MQLHWGPPPESDDFQPESQGWSGIREPRPVLVQLIALPIALLVAVLIYLAIPREILSINKFDFPIGSLLVIAVVCVPVHELFHAASHPGLGRSDSTLIGIWLTKGLFYAHYTGTLSRNRFLWVFATPFIVLTLIPLGLTILLGHYLPQNAVLSLALLALLNGAASAGDILGIGLIACQVPSSALVRNKGWKSYWKYGAA